MDRIAFWVEMVSVACVLLVQSLPFGFHFRRVRRVPWLLGLLAVIGVAGALGASSLWAVVLSGAILVAFSLVALVRGWRESLRFKAAWLKRFRESEPVVLEPPFEGRWKALETGPWAARNHHLAARDQWFATDWVRVDGASRGSMILAPVDGVVAYIEDGHADKPARRWVQSDRGNPAGNYVSLRVDGRHAAGREDVFVILAHLEQGSIAVRAGEEVRAGDAIGRCGNSGNTTIPHLHIHAQPAERFAAGSVWGVPVCCAWDETHSGGETWPLPGRLFEGRQRAERENAGFPQKTGVLHSNTRLQCGG